MGILSVLLRRENKTLMGGNNGTNRGAGIGEKIIQRLPHLGICPICSHYTQALLLMPSSAYGQEHDMDASSVALPAPYRYRGGCLQPTTGLSTGTPMEELGEGLKELKGFSTP